jgi:hypothetical protein
MKTKQLLHYHAAFLFCQRNGVQLVVYNHFLQDTPQVATLDNQAKASFAYLPSPKNTSQPIDFRYAAAAATPFVVHVKSTIKVRTGGIPWWKRS